jgi:hypothetical protein
MSMGWSMMLKCVGLVLVITGVVALNLTGTGR